MPFNPVALAIVVLAALGFVGALLYFFRDRRTFKGHEEYAEEVRAIAKRLSGADIFRDGEDLVVSGNLARFPVIVRFSYVENTPGLHIRMQAPSNFTLSVFPKGLRGQEGRVQLRTADDAFDARVTARTDHPLQARMYLGGKGVVAEMSRLCCSSQATVVVSHGTVEQAEALIPTPNTARHVIEHLESIAKLVQEIARMPGADTVKVRRLRRERRLAMRAAIVVGVMAALATVIAASHMPADPSLPEAVQAPTVPAGVLATEAPLISGVKNWHGAVASDLDGDAAAWVRTFGVENSPRVALDLTGSGKRDDAAYLLSNTRGERRVVLLAAGQTVYDVKYPSAGLLTRIPKRLLSGIEWQGRAPEDPDGDAVLLVRTSGDRASGLVLYLSDGRIVSGVPLDYQSLRLVEP